MKNNTKTIDEYIIGDKQNREKTEKISFLSHISHGIRTPLNSIMGFSRLLNLRSKTDSKQQEYIQGILNGSNLLLQFVDNVMDLSQFESDSYTLRVEKYDLNKVLWEFTEEFYNQRIENSETNINLMLIWDAHISDLEIETDSALLKKILQRMINLALVKYPTQEFELGYRKINGGSLNLFVRPAGDTIKLEYLKDESPFFKIDEYNSFDYFNYKVLKESLKALGGELSDEQKKQELSILIPKNFYKTKNVHII